MVSPTRMLIENPVVEPLSETEELLQEIGIAVELDDSEAVFYSALLKESNRLITPLSKSRVTKRNNLCVAVRGRVSTLYGLLLRVGALRGRTQSSRDVTFVVFQQFTPTGTTLFNDTVTNSQIHQHLIPFYPPRCVQSVAIS